jgi:hypothetical protein
MAKGAIQFRLNQIRRRPTLIEKRDDDEDELISMGKVIHER